MMLEKKGLGFAAAQHAAGGAETADLRGFGNPSHHAWKHGKQGAALHSGAKHAEKHETHVKEAVLLAYAVISVGFGIACVVYPAWSDSLFSIWLLITFSLWLYLFLTMIRLLCDLQRLQKMREELYEVRYQEMFERLSQVRREFRSLQEHETESEKTEKE